MFKKLLKNQKGTALVFVMILITNAMIIVASIILISVMQEKAGARMTFTPAAYQKADGGLEYILKKINHDLTDPTDDVGDLCTDVTSGGKCTITALPDVSAYFFEGESIMSSGDLISAIEEVKVVGEAGTGINRVSRSLRTTLFKAP